MSIRVFLLDDHEIVRAGLRSLFETDDEFVVVGEAATAAEALDRIPATRPHVAILDVRLPDGNGIEVCRDIRSHSPEIACVMLTSYADDEALVAAVMAGAAGYVLKQVGAVSLVAVSKGFPAPAIVAAAAAGQRAFGENYLQEAQDKVETLRDAGLEWHFIGPIQSNKTREIAAHFAWVHGVERLRIVERLSVQRPAALPPLNVCVQVNVSGESAKSGCPPRQAAELCAAVAALPRLRLRGLMTIPAATEEAEASRPAFRTLRTLFEQIRARGAVNLADFDTLSMGMSADFEVAVEEGATLVRVGSAIFGERSGNQ